INQRSSRKSCTRRAPHRTGGRQAQALQTRRRPREGRPRAALQRQLTAAAAAIAIVLCGPVTAKLPEMAARALVLVGASVKLTLRCSADPAPLLLVAAATAAVPPPPVTSSVSAGLNSRIIMSLSRSSNVPVSYLIVPSPFHLPAGKHPALQVPKSGVL